MPRKKKTKIKSSYDVASSRSTILDQYGNNLPSPQPQASTMYDGSLPYNSPRPRTQYIQNFYNNDFESNVTAYDHGIIVSRSREIYSNVGAVRSAIAEMADFAIGDGWEPKFYGDDEEFKKIATEWISNWGTLADVRGQPWSLKRGLKLACISVLRDGDCLALLTSDHSGYFPRIQWVPSHRIGTRNSVIQSGPFKGYDCINGSIVSDRTGATIGYNIFGNAKDGSEDRQVSIVDAQIVFDPEYIEQGRGLPALASGISDWMDYKKIKGFELQAIGAAASQAIQMYVPPEEMDDVSGEYNDSPFKTALSPSSGSRNITIETLQGGEVQIWRPDSGARLEVLEYNRPGPDTAKFLLDNCLRNAFLAMRWPVELAFDLNSKGAGTKLAVIKAQRRILDLQTHVILPLWKRVINYAVAKAIKNKVLPPSNDWWKWEPAYPRDLVFDAFKDVKSDIELYNRGFITGTQLASSYGYDLETNYRQKAKELKLRDEIAKEEGVNPNELVMLTQQGNSVQTPEEQPPTQEDEEEESEQTPKETPRETAKKPRKK